jgi:HEPN domain-containing protein
MSISPDQHREQARRNLAHAEQLLAEHGDDPTAVQWAVTAAFYCAVHCVQAHLIRQGYDPQTHMKRAEAIADPNTAVPPMVQIAYELLKQRSEKARYRLAEFDGAIVRRRILGHYLQIVTSFARL